MLQNTQPRDSSCPRSTKPTFSNFRWVIVGLLFLATTINYVDRQILALLKSTLDRELGGPMNNTVWSMRRFKPPMRSAMWALVGSLTGMESR